MIRRPPRSTRTDTLFPTRRSSDLAPVHGGSLKSHQPKAVLGMPGVRAVVVLDPAKTKGTPVPNKGTWGAGDNQVQSGVAVIADHYWQAKKAQIGRASCRERVCQYV